MEASGVAFAEHITVLTIAHAIKPRFVVIEFPASSRVLPSFAVPLTKCASLLHGYSFQLLTTHFLGTWLLRLNSG